jgi:NitT/TauT family transport system substrate-binding protein
LVVLAALTVFWLRKPPPPPPEPLVVAVANAQIGVPILIAAEQGFFAAEGLQVTLQRYPTGKLALDALLRGEAEVATVAETPIMFASFREPPFSVIANYATSGEVSLVARADRGIRQVTDLRGRRVGISVGTITHYFLHVLLSDQGLTETDVELVAVPTPEQPTALVEGRVDAVAAFAPCTTQSRVALQGNAISFSAGIRYVGFSSLVVSRDFSQRRPEAALRLLRATDRAITWMDDHRREAIDLTARELGMEVAAVEETWDELRPALAFDQAFILLLEAEARWAIGAGLAPGATVPNYLDYIDPSALKRLYPETVSVIQGRP